MVGFMIAPLYKNRQGGVVALVSLAVFGLACAILHWRAFSSSIEKSVLRNDGPGLQRTLCGDFEIQVSSEGLRCEHALFSTTMKWGGFIELVELPDYIFLMLSPMRGYIIPKATLSGTTPPELVAVLRKHLSARPN
jgi:hypothetical protein